jgi:hypothetical protein
MLGATACSGGARDSGAEEQEVLLWTEPLAEKPFGVLVADQSVIVAGSTDLTAYDVETGDVAWVANIGQTVGVTPMAVDGDVVVVARPYDTAQAFDIETGERVDDYDGGVPDERAQSYDTPPGYSFGNGELSYEGDVVWTDPDDPPSTFGPVVARIARYSILSMFDRLIVVADDGEVLLDESFVSTFGDEGGWATNDATGTAAAWLADGNLHVVRVPL